MSYSHITFGLPSGDPVNSNLDREAREERYQQLRAELARVGEATPRGGGRLMTLPTAGELSQADDRTFGLRTLDLPTVAELEREAERVAKVGKFHGWLAEKAKELGLFRE